jgi:tight adherence protein B
MSGPVLNLLLAAALAAIFGGVLLVVLTAGGWSQLPTSSGRMKRRLKHVTIGSPRGASRHASSSSAGGGSTVARSAVDLAGRVTTKGDLDLKLSTLLGSAGLKWSPAEWLLLHVGIAVAAAMAMTLLTGFRIAPTLIGLALGIGGPLAYLSIKGQRRRAKFNSGLADMLQLMAGSLSAGYSVPQALDTVARESTGPIAEELERALLQARVGVPLEDALEQIAERMRSVDFSWIVMAIRVQREVGGNLAEVLKNVADTLRERDRIRRQVQVLSAEGRLSAWVLGALPVAFAIYLIIVRPEYIGLLVTSPLGLLMLVGTLILFVIGVFWLTRIVKVKF